MLRISRVVIVSILIVTQWPLWAQNNTNSPYTRFGYGELANRSFGAGRAMGGVGYGLRSSKQINPMNPASYSSMDSLTFLFDFGLAGQLSWFNDGTNKQNDINGNFEYAAMQFPLSRRIAASIGVLPYSYVGYNFGSLKNQGDAPYLEQFYGRGGLNEVYVGLSIDIWKKRLSVGANVGYMFGNITHTRDITFLDSSNDGTRNLSGERRFEVKDVKYDFGVQYTQPLSATQRVTLGLVFSPANKLHTKSYEILEETVSSSVVETTADTITGQRFDIPNSYGIGLSYVKDNKLTVAADFLYETWDDAQFFSEKGEFKNRMKVAGGLEYIPNASNRAFFSRVRYRVGGHYSNSYLNITTVEGASGAGYGYDEYGVSVGFGLPLIDNRSYVNLSFEYVKIKPESRLMIDEQYFKFTVNYTFNERWFFKLRMD